MGLKVKKIRLQRLAYVLLIIITASAQNVKGLVLSPFGVHAMPLVALVVSIAIFEKSVPSLFFGVFAGIMWDMTSASTDGFFAVALAVVGFVCSLLITFEMRDNIFTALLLTFGASLLCGLVYWLLFILIKGYDMSVYVYFRYYFTSAIYTSVFTLIYYYIVRAVKLIHNS